MLPRVVAILLGLLYGISAAQSFPSKPIRLVVPFPAGSATDIVARTLSVPVAQALGQPVVVENKAGADGAVGAGDVARAAPDGYTILLATNSPMSAVPLLRKSPPYDPVGDFTPITDVGRFTFFLAVHPSVPARNLAELIAHAKANPGKLNYATGNTTGIVTTAYLASLAGVQLVHVPYKGEPQAIADVLAGRVHLMVGSATTIVPHAREGKLRVLATTLGRRASVLPDVPSMAEAGLPQFALAPWAGLFGPPRLPREIVDRLQREFVAAMALPEVQATMEKQAFALQPSTPGELANVVRAQLESFRRAIADAGLQPE